MLSTFWEKRGKLVAAMMIVSRILFISLYKSRKTVPKGCAVDIFQVLLTFSCRWEQLSLKSGAHSRKTDQFIRTTAKGTEIDQDHVAIFRAPIIPFCVLE